jgi:hypothetical protein
MECNKIKDLLTPYVDGEIAADKKRLVDSHVRDCSSCLSELLFLQRFKRAAAELPRKTAPDGFLEGVHEKLSASPPLIRFIKSLFSFEAMKSPAGAAAILVTAAIIVAVVFNVSESNRSLRIAGDRPAATDIKDKTPGKHILENKAEEKSGVRLPAAPVYEIVLNMQGSNVMRENEADDASYRSASRSASEKPSGVMRDEMAKKAVQAESPAKRTAPAAADTRKAVKQTVLTHDGSVISDAADFMLVEIPSVNLGRFTRALRATEGISLVTVPAVPKNQAGRIVLRLRFSSSR